MKTASTLCIIALAGYALGTADGEYRTIAGKAHDDALEANNNGTSRQILPPCVLDCEQRILPEHSCEINNSSTKCCKPIVNTDLSYCIQTTCPKLDDLRSWQKHRAAACNITPRNDGKRQVAVSASLFAIATLSVMGRFLSRSALTSGPGFWWDDWVALIVWILGIELLACLPGLHENGSGMDITGPITTSNVRAILHWVFASVPFYVIGTYGAKIVMVLLYMRMWEANTVFRKFCWLTNVILLGLIVGFGVSGLVLVWPLHYYDGETAMVRQNYLGVEIYPAIFSIAAANVAMDFWVLLMPIIKLRALGGVSKSRRIGISMIFLLGFAVTACSIVRITYIVPLRNSTNPSWAFGQFGLWSQIEVHCSMVTCNIPTMAGLVHRLRAKYQKRIAYKVHSSEGQEMSSRATTTTTGSSVTKEEMNITSTPMTPGHPSQAEVDE